MAALLANGTVVISRTQARPQWVGVVLAQVSATRVKVLFNLGPRKATLVNTRSLTVAPDGHPKDTYYAMSGTLITTPQPAVAETFIASAFKFMQQIVAYAIQSIPVLAKRLLTLFCSLVEALGSASSHARLILMIEGSRDENDVFSRQSLADFLEREAGAEELIHSLGYKVVRARMDQVEYVYVLSQFEAALYGESALHLQMIFGPPVSSRDVPR